MEPVVTSEEMQARDRYAIEKLKIPSIVLMENAGRCVVEIMEHQFGRLQNAPVLVICGKGNNGGDGYVAARHLYNRGADVTVLSLGKENELKNDAKINFKILKELVRRENPKLLRLLLYRSGRMLSAFTKSDFILDAIFGTGFSGEVKDPYSSIVEWINRQSSRVVSIDVPSGVDADTGDVVNTAVSADLTVTMANRKIGLLCGKGAGFAGTVKVADISIPKELKTVKSAKTFLTDADDVRIVLPRRPKNAHKHSVGKVFILAGSTGFTGAAALTSQSALRAGAGAVVLGTPLSVYPILAKKLTEVMVQPLPETEDGSLSMTGYEAISKHISWADLVICGPGISRNSETCQLIWHIISECDKPLLIDADGLNNLSEKISLLKNHRSPDIILTPHTGELARLTGVSADSIERNRITVARRVAQQYRITLVLKGAPTVIADEDGTVLINPTGNPGMASAGMGDVLAGLIGGLWAQGMNKTEAAYAGVFLHGYAGDLARLEFGEKSLLAKDVQDLIPRSFLEIERSKAL